MAIDDECCRRVVEELTIEHEAFAIFVEGRSVFEIALMLRQDGLPVLHQTERRLELAAHRQKFGRDLKSGGKVDRGRREAARAAQHPGFSAHDPYDRIVDPIGDVAIVHQRIARNAGKASARLGIIDDGGLVRQVAAGHDQRTINLLQQDEVQWRRRQHEAQSSQPWGDRLGQALRTVSAQQQDRRLHPRELALFLGADRAIAPDDRDVARHERKRLGIALLQAPQTRNRDGVGGVTSQMISTETLDRQDFAVPKETAGSIDVVRFRVEITSFPIKLDQYRCWATSRTGDRFGMKTAIVRVLVFGATILA